MTITNVSGKFRVTAIIDRHFLKKETTYVNIRVAEVSNKNFTVDIPVYFSSGMRMKVKPASFGDGSVKKGFYSAQETKVINERIEQLWQQIKSFVGDKERVSRPMIEAHIYGYDFLSTHKKSRTKELHIPITESKPSSYFIELRKRYPKYIQPVIESHINDDGFEEDRRIEIVIDPLSLSDDSFTKYFPRELYSEMLSDYSGDKNDRFFTDSFVKFKAQLLFFNTSQKDVQTITNSVLDSFKKHNERKPNTRRYNVTVDNSTTTVSSDTQQLISMQKAQNLSLMKTEDIYKNNLFDKNNILHLFGMIYYPEMFKKKKLENQQNERVIVRLYDYVANSGASIKVTDFNEDWIRKFIDWLTENGHTGTKFSKTFDPFHYDSSVFKTAKREQYKPSGVDKQLDSLKVCVKHLYDNGYLPTRLDLRGVQVAEKIETGTRITHNLLLHEYETILNYKFQTSKIKEYGVLFDQLKSSGIIKGTFINDVTIANLNAYRDVFCYQVMAGGLRGLPEYQSLEYVDYDKKGDVLRLYQAKLDQFILNPSNKYLDMLKKRNKTFPVAKTPEILNGYLKLIGHIIGLNREVEKGVRIKDNLSQYWARKTFGNILFNEGLTIEEISLFTGHELENKSELATSYIELQNVNRKRKIYQKIGLA